MNRSTHSEIAVVADSKGVLLTGDPEFEILEKKGIIAIQWLHQSAAADL